jgi:hypothetical protein
MPEPVTYALERANGTAELTLSDGRFIVKTQGVGLIDKLQTIDIALTDLDKFCVVPTIAIQNVVDQTGATLTYDDAYDAEFIFSYRDGGKVKKKRVFIENGDEAWQRVRAGLKERCPSASLLDMDPAEAQKQIGVVSGKTGLYILLAIIFGVPLISTLIFGLPKLLGK